MIPAVIAITIAALTAAAPPKGPPPKVAGTEVAPPPAWAEGSGRSLWMAFGSYCWTGNGKAACVDMIPPSGRTDVPTLRVGRRSRISIHLRFRPTRVEAFVAGRRLRPAANGDVLTWRAGGGGLVMIETKSAAGSASYLMRLVIRS